MTTELLMSCATCLQASIDAGLWYMQVFIKFARSIGAEGGN